MSFSPLPKTFTDLCLDQDHPRERILELGCGDGRFREILAGQGIPCWGLDRVGPCAGTVAEVVGDALYPPVATESLDILVAANLLRHAGVQDRTFGFLSRWLELLKPGGSLFLFEDEPGDFCAGAVCYRDLQEFLCRLMPESRGPLLPLEDFRSRVTGMAATFAWEFGLVRNRQTIDARAVLNLLGRGAGSGGAAARLLEAIERDGLDPGYFWWARVSAVAERAKA